jgi:hypothetical protein
MTLEFVQQNWLRDGMTPNDHRYQWIAPMPTPRVLAVASVHLGPNLWRVYVDAVPGRNHDLEWLEVARFGGKLSEARARELFPNMPDELRYAE